MSADGRCIGHTDISLVPDAHVPLRTLASSWRGAPPIALMSSDLSRARESATVLAEELTIDPATIVVDPRLREMHFGAWEGRRWDELEEHDGVRLNAWMTGWTDTAVPDGEGFPELLRRVAAWADEVPAARAEGEAVVVAHAGSIRALLCHWFGFSPAQVFRLRFDYGRVSTIMLPWTPRGEPELRILNSMQFG